MQVKLMFVTEENQLPDEMKAGEAAMLVLHRGERLLTGMYYNDGFVKAHHPFIVCANLETAKDVATKLSDKLVFEACHVNKNWLPVLVVAPVACTCGSKPHEAADRELFESLRGHLA